MKRSLYRMYDPDLKCEGAKFVRSLEEARKWNEEGWGIFWTVNEFKGARIKENLVRINSWHFETDQGSKYEQWKRIKSGPILPSLIVETMRGFHVYFNAKDGTPGNWEAIVWSRLVPFYQGDPNAKDICRILRVPGFYHCKDIFKRFLVREVFSSGALYSEEDMLSVFPEASKQPAHKTTPRAKPISTTHEGDDFWERVYRLDCQAALERLSGSPYVNGEVYSFRQVPRGRLNIIVNGEQCSCFIDEHGRIGSSAGGGPTIAQWLKYFGHSNKEVYRILKEVFPELLVGIERTA